MYEVILRETKELSFCRVLDGENLSDWENINDSKVRSVFLFEIDKLPDDFITTFILNFKLLKVLDFEDAPIGYLPEGVGNLFHLFYLSVRKTKVKLLPKSIGRLLNLETLDLKYSLVSEFPVDIKNLKKLRHLLAYSVNYTYTFNFIRGTEIQNGFGDLTDLQKLAFVEANSEVVKELMRLRKLKRLGINRLSTKNGKELCTSIAKMEDLEALNVTSISTDEIIDLQSMTPPPQNLQRLYLKGALEKLPDWISKLQNLIRIRLFWSGLTDDPMQVLGALPNLLEFGLYDFAYNGEHLHFNESSFLKLQELHLCNLKELKSVMIVKGAIPLLRELRVGPCPLLKEIPTGIEHLTNLKILGFWYMLEEIKSFKNWEKLEHIPKVLVCYYGEGNKLFHKVIANNHTHRTGSAADDQLSKSVVEAELECARQEEAAGGPAAPVGLDVAGSEAATTEADDSAEPKRKSS